MLNGKGHCLWRERLEVVNLNRRGSGRNVTTKRSGATYLLSLARLSGGAGANGDRQSAIGIQTLYDQVNSTCILNILET
jgi:hypothetical protein